LGRGIEAGASGNPGELFWDGRAFAAGDAGSIESEGGVGGGGGAAGAVRESDGSRAVCGGREGTAGRRGSRVAADSGGGPRGGTAVVVCATAAVVHSTVGADKCGLQYADSGEAEGADQRCASVAEPGRDCAAARGAADEVREPGWAAEAGDRRGRGDGVAGVGCERTGERGEGAGGAGAGAAGSGEEVRSGEGPCMAWKVGATGSG